MANLIPSKYQIAVYDFISNGNGNAVIDAVAGSGKSTTIVNTLKLIPTDKSVLFLAFNKAIVEELKIKIGNVSNVEIKTLHSLGMSVITKSIKTQVNDSKYKTYLSDAIKFGAVKATIELVEDELSDYKQNIAKLVDLARVCLITDAERLMDIANKYSIAVLDNECQMALNIVNLGKNEVGQIDFCDMIYFPNVKAIKCPQYDYVLIDECQDLNAAQRELFLKCLKPSGRFVAVGDPRQAIYGFAGADVESFNILKGLPNTTLLPLSVCYRCDGSIINLAKTLVPQIEAKENVPEGIVNQNGKLEDIMDGDMVLCRVTAPLIALCMLYIGNGVKAYVKGKDIGANLINMINKTKKRNIADVLDRLTLELGKTAAKIAKRNHITPEEAKDDNLYRSHADKIRAIEVLAGNLKTSDAVINRIETIFKDNDRSGICLSTIHKSKGLEANNVHIICEEKMLLKHCMKVAWTAEQEYNLVYVAYTRAKHNLSFVRDFKFE